MACRLYRLILYKRDLSALSAVHSIERKSYSPERAFNIVLETPGRRSKPPHKTVQLLGAHCNGLLPFDRD